MRIMKNALYETERTLDALDPPLPAYRAPFTVSQQQPNRLIQLLNAG